MGSNAMLHSIRVQDLFSDDKDISEHVQETILQVRGAS